MGAFNKQLEMKRKELGCRNSLTV